MNPWVKRTFHPLECLKRLQLSPTQKTIITPVSKAEQQININRFAKLRRGRKLNKFEPELNNIPIIITSRGFK